MSFLLVNGTAHTMHPPMSHYYPIHSQGGSLLEELEKKRSFY